jgi:hypothetical protein
VRRQAVSKTPSQEEPNLDAGRTSPGAIAAAIGGAVVIISLFLEWVGVGGNLGGVSLPPGAENVPGASAAIDAAKNAATQTGWEVNNSLDIYLFIVGVFAIVPALVMLTGSDVEIPYFSAGVGFLLTVIGIICLLAAMFIGFPSGAERKIGMWLALAALIGTAVAQYFAMRDEVAAEY